MKIKPKAAPELLPSQGSPGRASGAELGHPVGREGWGAPGLCSFGVPAPPSCPRSPCCELCRHRPWPPGPGGPRCSTGSWGCSACPAGSAGLTPGAAARRAPAFTPLCLAALRETPAKAAPLGSLPGSTGPRLSMDRALGAARNRRAGTCRGWQHSPDRCQNSGASERGAAEAPPQPGN